MNGYTEETVDFEIYADPMGKSGDNVWQADWIADLCSDNTAGGFDVTVANAKLIAAAPEMLEALIEEVIHAEGFGFPKNPRVVIMRNIIEKATGKTWEEIKALL